MLKDEERARLDYIEDPVALPHRGHISQIDAQWLLALVRRLDAECERLRAELAAEADLRAGRFKTFDTMGEMIVDLKGGAQE